MRNRTIPTDLSKVDIHSDFDLFPPLFKTPDDIEAFIAKRGVKVPILCNLLALVKSGELDITPTEKQFYFDNLFDYIYDVYRVPVEATYQAMEKWLESIESDLVWSGFMGCKQRAYSDAIMAYQRNLEITALFKESAPQLAEDREPKEINCYRELHPKHEDYYNSKNPKLIEAFWIKNDRYTNQPVHVGDESYSRVYVYPERVYIFGCDDSSYTLYTQTVEEAKEFAKFLKCAAPVWSFNWPHIIHPKLEFTN